MNLFLVLVYGISLSMDAFAVAVCKGLTIKKAGPADAALVGLYFGLFQGLMPLGGYFLASSFRTYIEKLDHWIAFGLLLYIGGKMIWESFHQEKIDETETNPLAFKKMILLAVATSIDALAVGIAFCCAGMPVSSYGVSLGIIAACAVIAATTFIISASGVLIGRLAGSKLRSHAELIGGIILVLLGVKILVEHLTGISIF